MANAVRKAIVTTMVEGILTDLMIQTSSDNVLLDDDTLLSAKLAEIITSLNGKATPDDVTTAVSTAIDNLIAGAPGTYDTLKEIADYISAHEEVVTAINSAIGNKVDKAEGYSLVADTLITKLENLDAHTHSNKSVLDGISAADVANWNGKTKVTFSETQPANMQNGDVWVQLIPEATGGEE